jgi:hypothetical protein
MVSPMRAAVTLTKASPLQLHKVALAQYMPLRKGFFRKS